MGVVRARVIFPYKVGHFFSSAGPLRADLVKFTIASRDVPRLAAAPGRPGGAAGCWWPPAPGVRRGVALRCDRAICVARREIYMVFT